MPPLVLQVRMSTKGQIVIPLEVRKRLGMKPGDRLVVVAGDSEAVLMTATRYAESLRGVAAGIYGKTREEIEVYVRGEREKWPG